MLTPYVPFDGAFFLLDAGLVGLTGRPGMPIDATSADTSGVRAGPPMDAGTKGLIMSAGTMPKLGPEMTMALEIVDAGEKDPARAASIATRAARRFPNFMLPAGADREVSFAQLRDHYAELAKVAAPVAAPEESVPPAAPEKAPTPARKSTPRKAAAAPARKSATPRKRAAVPAVETPAPVQAALTVLTLVHNGVEQTAIFGIEKNSPAHLAVGSAKKGGLGWWFYRDNESFYIPGSQGYAPDYVKINEAIGRLENLKGEHGEQLYRVESTIMTEVDGKALPVRKTREEMREWQRAYDGAKNTLTWEISMGTAVCATCNATDLGDKTARIVKGADGMPVGQCATCGGFASTAPVRIPVTLALPAAPVQAPESVEQPEKAECPLCKTMQLVKNGKLALHSFNGGACRGKLGVAVVDVEPEESAPKTRRTRTGAAEKNAAAQPVVVEDAQGLVVKIQIQRTLSRSKQGDVATDMRKAIERRVTSRGMRIELRRDKSTGVATITVLESAGRDRVDVEKALIGAVTSVAGFGNRVNK